MTAAAGVGETPRLKMPPILGRRIGRPLGPPAFPRCRAARARRGAPSPPLCRRPPAKKAAGPTTGSRCARRDLLDGGARVGPAFFMPRGASPSGMADSRALSLRPFAVRYATLAGSGPAAAWVVPSYVLLPGLPRLCSTGIARRFSRYAKASRRLYPTSPWCGSRTKGLIRSESWTTYPCRPPRRKITVSCPADVPRADMLRDRGRHDRNPHTGIHPGGTTISPHGRAPRNVVGAVTNRRARDDACDARTATRWARCLCGTPGTVPRVGPGSMWQPSP